MMKLMTMDFLCGLRTVCKYAANDNYYVIFFNCHVHAFVLFSILNLHLLSRSALFYIFKNYLDLTCLPYSSFSK